MNDTEQVSPSDLWSLAEAAEDLRNADPAPVGIILPEMKYQKLIRLAEKEGWYGARDHFDAIHGVKIHKAVVFDKNADKIGLIVYDREVLADILINQDQGSWVFVDGDLKFIPDSLGLFSDPLGMTDQSWTQEL